MTDTAPEVAARWRSLLLERSPEERFLMGVRMYDVARAMILASLPRGLAPDSIRRQLFARMYADMPAADVPRELRPR